MARPRKPRPELEGFIIEPQQVDLQEAIDAAEEHGDLVGVKIIWETPVFVDEGVQVAPGEIAYVSAELAETLRSRGMAE